MRTNKKRIFTEEKFHTENCQTVCFYIVVFLNCRRGACDVKN